MVCLGLQLISAFFCKIESRDRFLLATTSSFERTRPVARGAQARLYCMIAVVA